MASFQDHLAKLVPECLDSTAARDDGMAAVPTRSLRCTKLQSCQHQHTNTQFSGGLMPFLPPNQQCQSNEANTAKYLSLLTFLQIITYYKIIHIVQNNEKYRRHSKIKGNMQIQYYT